MQSIEARDYCESDESIHEGTRKEGALLQEKYRLLPNVNKELVKRYIESREVLEGSVGKLVKSVATRLVGMVIYISRDIPKSFLREISKMELFSEQLNRNLTKRSKQGFSGGNDIGDGDGMVLLYPFLLVDARI